MATTVAKTNNDEVKVVTSDRSKTAWNDFLIPLAVAVVGTVAINGVTGMFTLNSSIVALREQLKNAEGEISELKEREVSGQTIEAFLEQHDTDLQRGANDIVNLRNEMNTEVTNLRNQLTPISDITSQLQARANSNCELPETVAKLRERVAALEARLSTETRSADSQ